jgi:SAM-dependent methyltransferase
MAPPAPAEPSSLRVRTASGTLPLGYARDGLELFLIARDRAARWPIEILRNGRAELLLPEGQRSGTAELVADQPSQARILARFLAKYGPDQFARWYEHPARIVRVHLDAPGAAAGRSGGATPYYDWLEREFDNIADDYDHHITGNRMNRLLRDRSLGWLRPRFEGRRRILEVGCGSGMETIPMLRAGHSIVAVDISERMLAVVERKAAAEGRSGQLTTRRLRARDLGRLLEEFGPESFEAAYSTYGALNCEPDLRPIPAALRTLLPLGAPFVAGVYNRWCLFELAGYGLTLNPHRALGRATNPVLFGSSRFCVDVYAHSVGDFDRLFAPAFRRERVEGVPVFLPPSDLVKYAEKFSRHFERLSAADAWLSRRWPWNRLGDHFLMTFVRAS